MNEVKIQLPKDIFEPASFLDLEGKLECDDMKLGPDELHFDGPIKWQCTLSNTGKSLFCSGIAHASISTQCARCLDEARIDMEAPIEYLFFFDEQEAIDEELEKDEYAVIGEDKIIDLGPAIVGAILLAFPRVPLCSEDCKGLCPKCGTNLNESQCDCDNDDGIDEFNPFAKLREIKFDEQK